MVVLGGTSGERAVSLESGKACINALKDKGYKVSTFDPKTKNENSYITKDTIKISKEVFLTSNNSIIEDIKNDIGPENYKINMGYAGWDGSQLQEEIKNGDWLIKPLSQNFIFDIPDNDMWEFSTLDFGFDSQNYMGKSGKA